MERAERDYEKGYKRMGLGFIAIMVGGILSYLVGLIFLSVVSTRLPADWWMITLVGFILILAVMLALGVIVAASVLILKGFRALAGVVGGSKISEGTRFL